MVMPDQGFAPTTWRVAILTRSDRQRERLTEICVANGLNVVDLSLEELIEESSRQNVDVLLIDVHTPPRVGEADAVELLLERESVPVLLHDGATTRWEDSISDLAWGRRLCEKLVSLACEAIEAREPEVRGTGSGETAGAEAPLLEECDEILEESDASDQIAREMKRPTLSFPFEEPLADEESEESEQGLLSTDDEFLPLEEGSELEEEFELEDEEDTGVFQYPDELFESVAEEDPTGVNRVAPWVWVLGASIGGPQALKRFLSHLPADLPVAFILAQHIGAPFVTVLVEQLRRICKLDVRPAEEGFVIRANELLVAPVGSTLRFDEFGSVVLQPAAEHGVYSPSIDEVMLAVARHYGPRSGAILFSGMGNDGVRGARAIAAAGGKVWTQEPASCVVSSMVAGAQETGVVEHSAPPEGLAGRLVEWMHEEKLL
ncbi:MAG TPA: chemotaxis protein CheB [Thiotrichales bacterium]|nr:chemotaxis protein CheB [Thiotrichales bacterium]